MEFLNASTIQVAIQSTTGFAFLFYSVRMLCPVSCLPIIHTVLTVTVQQPVTPMFPWQLYASPTLVSVLQGCSWQCITSPGVERTPFSGLFTEDKLNSRWQ